MNHYDDYLDAIFNAKAKIEAMECGEADDFYLDEARDELQEANDARGLNNANATH